MKIYKYHASRFDRADCADRETKDFSNKAKALQWCKRCKHWSLKNTSWEIVKQNF